MNEPQLSFQGRRVLDAAVGDFTFSFKDVLKRPHASDACAVRGKSVFPRRGGFILAGTRNIPEGFAV